MIAQRILAAFSLPFTHDGREFQLSASIGIRVNDVASATPDALLRDAEAALAMLVGLVQLATSRPRRRPACVTAYVLTGVALCLILLSSLAFVLGGHSH